MHLHVPLGVEIAHTFNENSRERSHAGVTLIKLHVNVRVWLLIILVIEQDVLQLLLRIYFQAAIHYANNLHATTIVNKAVTKLKQSCNTLVTTLLQLLDACIVVNYSIINTSISTFLVY